MPKVALISNISHYYHTALSLHRHGYLGTYITGPSALENESWMRRFGYSFHRLWKERMLRGIPPSAVKRIWLPEIVRKTILRFGGSGEYSNWAHNELFARKAARLMPDCDVVHFVNTVGWQAAAKAKRRGATLICDMREEHPNFQESLLAEEAKRLNIEFTAPGSSYKHHVLQEVGIADYIFCPSVYAKRTFLEHGVSEEKLVVCPYGVDSARFTTGEERPRIRKTFSILFLGQICMRKGVHYLLEGFRNAALADARLILAGPVDPSFRPVLEQYRGLFEEIGSVAYSRVHQHYLGADLFVMPSLADSYGLAVLEAMSAQLPVIVSENTGAAGQITNGREGFVVPIRDSQAIADRLTFLYENREQCASMGMAARITAQSLDWANYQSICANFYKSLFSVSSSL
jgi:glycosyltransferase involved in cell wall biosynthesis